MLSLLPIFKNPSASLRAWSLDWSGSLCELWTLRNKRYCSSRLLPPLDSDSAPHAVFSQWRAVVSPQGLCLRQQEQPPNEGAGGASPVEGRRAKPRCLWPAGPGHGQRHLPQVCLAFFSLNRLLPTETRKRMTGNWNSNSNKQCWGWSHRSSVTFWPAKESLFDSPLFDVDVGWMGIEAWH